MSILRLRSLVELAKSVDNPTWYNAPIIQWSVIEINVGLICACMPTLRLALVRMFKVLGDSTLDKSYPTDYHMQGITSGRGNTSRVVATADRDRDMMFRGVECRKSYNVEYTQADDSSIMPMTDFDGGQSVKTRSERSNSSKEYVGMAR